MLDVPTIPTIEQSIKINNLKKLGYLWDKKLSVVFCAVVLSKQDDIWVFGLSGEISHNPDKTNILI